jgi:hypothetical protein
MPGKVRNFSKQYARRGAVTERSSQSKLVARLRLAEKNHQLPTRPASRPQFKIRPTSVDSALFQNMHIPTEESLEEILQFIRTIIFYKAIQQILFTLTKDGLKKYRCSEERLTIIQQLAVKSIIKIALPLAEISEERKYPQNLQYALENYKSRLDQLSEGIASLILTTISEKYRNHKSGDRGRSD